MTDVVTTAGCLHCGDKFTYRKEPGEVGYRPRCLECASSALATRMLHPVWLLTEETRTYWEDVWRRASEADRKVSYERTRRLAKKAAEGVQPSPTAAALRGRKAKTMASVAAAQRAQEEAA